MTADFSTPGVPHVDPEEVEERYCDLIAKRLSNCEMTLDFGSAS